MNEKSYDLKILDTPGGFRDGRMKADAMKYIKTYANTDLFVFCYDSTDHFSLMKLKKYYEEVRDFLEMDEATD